MERRTLCGALQVVLEDAGAEGRERQAERTVDGGQRATTPLRLHLSPLLRLGRVLLLFFLLFLLLFFPRLQFPVQDR
jgi:hypothetical protein